MKIHSTNYTNTFITIAEDCPVSRGEIPPLKGAAKTVANIQFDMISMNPYQYTSDEVLFRVFADKNDLTKNEYQAAKQKLFLKRATLLQGFAFDKTLWLIISHLKLIQSNEKYRCNIFNSNNNNNILFDLNTQED